DVLRLAGADDVLVLDDFDGLALNRAVGNMLKPPAARPQDRKMRDVAEERVPFVLSGLHHTMKSEPGVLGLNRRSALFLSTRHHAQDHQCGHKEEASDQHAQPDLIPRESA